ncbi:MAG: serine/threonine-protein kinase, partial [Planctomycetota bacterium]
MSEAEDPELSGPFGSYEILKLIGKGGMGSVYLARQPTLDRNIVIKVVHSALVADDGVARFQREAMTAAKVVSDNIVQVYETGVERDLPYIAMEYVEGFSAAEIVKMRGKLPWQEAVKIVVAAARGLEAAHASGVLHRDVKPANILVANDGRIKVADFGLAKHPKHEATADPGVITGSPLYMAPEQIDGSAPLDHRADIYSLGATLFELLTGKPPFYADSPMTVMTLVLTAPLPNLRELVPTIPVALERACTKMLSRELDRRMPSMAAVIEALEAIPPE